MDIEKRVLVVGATMSGGCIAIEQNKLEVKARAAIVIACEQGLLLESEVNQSLLDDVMDVNKRRMQLDRQHAIKAANRAAVTARVARVELQNLRLF